MFLDGESISLTPIATPRFAQEPYRDVAPWGQTAYFELTVGLLKKKAASEKFELDVRETDDTTSNFFPTHEVRKTLIEYIRGRGITDD